MKLYHLTLLKNLDNIKKNGLIPQIGKNSSNFGEEVPAIYFFKDVVSLEDALTNWLGDCFEEEDELIILELNISEDLPEEDEGIFEVKILSKISPDKISFLKIV